MELLFHEPYPIIGTDLLSSFGLNVDLKNRRIVDSLTECQPSVKFEILLFLALVQLTGRLRFKRFWLLFRGL